MKKSEVYAFLEKKFPATDALAGDRVGLLVDTPREEVQRVLIALDVNEDTVQEAANLGCELIVVHHPLFFSPIDSIALDSTGKIIRGLIKNDIALYAIHTNFDSHSKIWLELLNLHNVEVLEPINDTAGIGYVGDLPKKLQLKELLAIIKEKLGLPQVRYVSPAEDMSVKRVAVCPGSGMSLLQKVLKADVDVYLTGDIKYHDALFAYQNGLALVDIEHYSSEVIYKKEIESELKDMEITTFISEKDINPFEVWQ